MVYICVFVYVSLLCMFCVHALCMYNYYVWCVYICVCIYVCVVCIVSHSWLTPKATNVRE